MAITYGNIFQYEATTTLDDAYTVPAGVSHVVSMINLCNFTNAVVTVTLKHAVGGAADDNKQYMYGTLSIGAYDTFQSVCGKTLSEGDIIRVEASANNSIAVQFDGSTIT